MNPLELKIERFTSENLTTLVFINNVPYNLTGHNNLDSLLGAVLACLDKYQGGAESLDRTPFLEDLEKSPGELIGNTYISQYEV